MRLLRERLLGFATKFIPKVNSKALGLVSVLAHPAHRLWLAGPCALARVVSCPEWDLMSALEKWVCFHLRP